MIYLTYFVFQYKNIFIGSSSVALQFKMKLGPTVA